MNLTGKTFYPLRMDYFEDGACQCPAELVRAGHRQQIIPTGNSHTPALAKMTTVTVGSRQA